MRRRTFTIQTSSGIFRRFRIVVRRARLKTHRKAEREVLVAKARALVEERLEHFRNIYTALYPTDISTTPSSQIKAPYNFTYKTIRIKNTKSRWGSCSKSGNLNFNYRIATLPPHLADYLVVHELCHLAEFNHSKAFWSLVAQTVPDWKERRRGLRGKA